MLETRFDYYKTLRFISNMLIFIENMIKED